MAEHGCSRGLAAFVLLAALTTGAYGQAPALAPLEAPADTIDNSLAIPDVSQFLPAATTREGMSTTLQILVIMTVLSLAPALLMMTTCFTRIIIVLALLRGL